MDSPQTSPATADIGVIGCEVLTQNSSPNMLSQRATQNNAGYSQGARSASHVSGGGNDGLRDGSFGRDDGTNSTESRSPDVKTAGLAPARCGFFRRGWLFLILAASFAAYGTRRVHQKASIIGLTFIELRRRVRGIWEGEAVDSGYEIALEAMSRTSLLAKAPTWWEDYSMDTHAALDIVAAADELAFANSGLTLSEGDTIKIKEMHDAAPKHADGVRQLAQEYLSIIRSIDSFAREGQVSLRHLLTAYYEGNIPIMASEVENLRSQLERVLGKIEGGLSHTDKARIASRSFRVASIRVADILYKRLNDGEKAEIEKNIKKAEMDRRWFKSFISSEEFYRIGEMELIKAEATLAKAFLNPIERQMNALLAYDHFLLDASEQLATIRIVVTETQQIVRTRLKSNNYHNRRIRESEEFVRGVDAVRNAFDLIITAVDDFDKGADETARRYQSDPMNLSDAR